jgi:hypothetical protein
MTKSLQKWQSDEEQSTIEYVVHKIRMGDVEDPDLFVASPIYEWQQTDAGKYVMENSFPTAMWVRSVDQMTYGYLYSIKAYFTPKQLTFFKLKFE